MDDIKLYAKSTEQLHQLLNITTEFSRSIHMEFGLDKCKTVTIEKGTLITTNEFKIDENHIMKGLSKEESYKYLGVLQLRGIRHKVIKHKLQEDFENRMHTICKSLLSFPNKIKAINTYAVPTLTYSFGVIKWSKTDLDNLYRLIRTIMTKHRLRHPKSATERLSLPQQKGGMGIIDIPRQCDAQIKSLRQYFHDKAGKHILFKTICEADDRSTPLQLSELNLEDLDQQQTIPKQIERWKEKELHGTHPHHLHQEATDITASNIYMQQSLFGETVGFIHAIQDRVMLTNNYKKFILKMKDVVDKCRRCGTNNETIEHIIGGCASLAGIDYTQRHDNVAKIVHQQLALQYKLLEERTPYYKYLPIEVLDNTDYKMYWDREITTDVNINANRPDIVVFNKKKKEVYIIDVAVPLNHNLQSTYATKINKYMELATEIKQMWRVETVNIFPLIISTTAIVPKTLTLNLQKLNISSVMPIISKSVVLDTCHIVRRFISAD